MTYIVRITNNDGTFRYLGTFKTQDDAQDCANDYSLNDPRLATYIIQEIPDVHSSSEDYSQAD